MYYGQRWLLLATTLLLAPGGFPGQCGEITQALRARLRGAGPAESVRAWKAEAARSEGPLRQALRASGVNGAAVDSR